MARIVVVADGVGVHGSRWVDAVCELGHQVHWVATRRPNAVTRASAITILEPIGNSPTSGAVKLMRNAATLRAVCRSFKPALVHAQFLTPCGWYAWMARCTPYVIQLWGSDILKHRDQPPHYRWLSKRALEGAALVTADSRNLINVARTVTPTLCEGPVLSWGVDTQTFHPAEGTGRARLKAALGIDSKHVILCTRNFGPDMNVAVLVEAFARIPQSHSRDCTLLLKKGFPLDLDSEAVRSVADRNGLRSRVRIIEDEYSYAGMADLYAISDVFVSIPTPGKDGLAQSLLDSLAAGCIPVVSRNADTMEVFGEGRSAGVIVEDPRDPLHVAAGCDAALHLALTQTDVARRNREYIVRHYERRACMERIQASIHEAASF